MRLGHWLLGRVGPLRIGVDGTLRLCPVYWHWELARIGVRGLAYWCEVGGLTLVGFGASAPGTALEHFALAMLELGGPARCIGTPLLARMEQ